MILKQASKAAHRAVLFCLFVMIPGAVRPQQSGQPYDSHSVIVADTEEVSLDLVIRDKHGRAVKDLKPEDVKIFDGGTPVTISELRMVTSEAQSDHLITLLYDRLDTSAGENARSITARMLKQQTGMRVSYEVFGIRDRMRLLQSFTSDNNAVTLAARVVTGGGKKSDPADLDVRAEKALLSASTPASAEHSRERTLVSTTLAALQEAQRVAQDEHARPALAGLLGLVHAQRELPGRKVIVYFARGWQADADTKDVIRSIAGAANRAGVSVYTVDANAIDTGAAQALISSVVMAPGRAAAQASAANPRSYGQTNPDIMTTPGQKLMASEQFGRFGNASSDAGPLELLAKQTGGLYIAAGGNPKKPLQRMFADMAAYYQASYVPPPHDSDGQFRPVSVTPVRRDLVVQARSGYFALPPATGSGVRPFEAPLLQVLKLASLPTDIRFHADVLRMGEAAGRDANALVVEVPMREIELVEDPNTNLFSGHISIVARMKDGSGAVVEHFSEDVPRHGALQGMAQARAEVITMQRHFSEPPGNYTLEAVVMDRNNGKTGGYRQKVEIPGEQSGPAISDLVLVRRETPYNPEADRGEPLVYEKSRIVPSLAAELPRDAKALTLFFLVHPESKAERPTLEMEVRRNGEPLMRSPLQLHAGSEAAVPYMTWLHTASFEPGDYELSAILTQGTAVARRSVAFTVSGGEAPTAANNRRPPGVEGAELPKQHTRAQLTLAAADGSLAPLSSEQQSALIAEARARALAYVDSLPNFICVEVTDRSVDVAGNGAWHHRDNMAELLRYYQKKEERVTLEVNGRRSDLAREDMQGTITHGEFGGLMSSVFRPEAKAEFHWKQAAVLGNGNVQVFAYAVPRATSDFDVIDVNGRRAVAAFHGLVYVDEATRAVRRITLESNDIPDTFVVRSSTFSVDYDYVAIGGHEYLMPVSGIVTVHRGKRTALLNEIEFRDYRKYGSQTSIEFR